MKKLGKILLFFCLFSSLLCGCQKEDVADGEFVATMESSGGDTKSYISQKHNCWEAADIVYVNGAPAKEFQLDAELGKAHFKPAERAESYRMFTFGRQEFTWNNDNTITFSLPQDYSGQDMPMYATTDDFGLVVFHNLFSVLHFYNIPKTGTNTITVTASKTERTWTYPFTQDITNHISGDFTVNFSSGTPTVTGGTGTGTGKTRTVTPSTGATEAWMVIPANESQEQEYTITITNWGTGYSNTKTTRIVAGNLINVDYNKISDCVLVRNAAELAAQLSNIANKYIRLANDIDFRGYGGYDHETFGSLTTLKIEGDGHSITIDRPIYDNLGVQAKVYNLTLKGTFTSSYNGAFANDYWSLLGILRGTISGDNYSSEVLYNGNPVPFAP